jgi:hypothetical protein
MKNENDIVDDLVEAIETNKLDINNSLGIAMDMNLIYQAYKSVMPFVEFRILWQKAIDKINLICPKEFTITENQVEQWETEYTVKELKITGSEHYGLIQNLCKEIWKLKYSNQEFLKKKVINVFANGCLESSIKALRFLANNDRPPGGEDNYNSMHLEQLADDLELYYRKNENEIPQ